MAVGPSVFRSRLQALWQLIRARRMNGDNSLTMRAKNQQKNVASRRSNNNKQTTCCGDSNNAAPTIGFFINCFINFRLATPSGCWRSTLLIRPSVATNDRRSLLLHCSFGPIYFLVVVFFLHLVGNLETLKFHVKIKFSFFTLKRTTTLAPTLI